MIPQYSRMGNNSSSGSGVFARRSFRTREKCLILLVFLTFCFVCFGGFFYLPDDFGTDKVLRVYKQFQKAGPEMFIPAPPIAGGHHHNSGGISDGGGGGGAIGDSGQDNEDPHVAVDRAKLNAKIREEFGDNLEKPELFKGKRTNGAEAPSMNAPSVEQAPAVAKPPSEAGVNIVDGMKFNLVAGDDPDPVARERRNKVKEMMIHAWNNYKLYAWGKNELRPLSKRPHTGSIFGVYDLGATIIDGLDTLYIMGLAKEFEEGRDWVARRFTFENVTADLSVFETNIRYVGGLLTLYAFTGDNLFRDKAKYVADKLLPSFQTPTGIPNALVNFKTGASKNYGWASGGSCILSEFGTLHMEFAYLSDITGDPVYRERVQNIRQILKELEKPKGLYPNYLNPKTGKWGQMHISLGALGDSFYEYLLKEYIRSGQTDDEAKELFVDAMDAIMKNIIVTSPSGLIYASDMKFDRLEHKMDHLACFAGGMFAMASQTMQNEFTEKYMEIGAGITNTCHESYIRTATHLGPEAFRFSEGAEAKALKAQEKYYILRPETFESYFILWRLTKDQKYRDWGWDAIQAIEKYCRTPNGYCGIKNVYLNEPQQDDVQQSFFLAEVLKYLYLLYSDDSLISFDEWTFNTEAHPLPIKGANPLYRMETSSPSLP